MTTAAINKKDTRGNRAATELLAVNVRAYLEIKHAFDQCEAPIKEVVSDMIALCEDPEASAEDRTRALHTIVEALFPMLATDFRESVERSTKCEIAGRKVVAEEEASFAERVEALMKAKRMTQEELAQKSGVGQPAISNMLRRQCRPQRKTVRKLAEALGVESTELWPEPQE